ncbi:FKBP-type peptidyl-prolyl cis-trans isomerase [Bacteroidota bacterium]
MHVNKDLVESETEDVEHYIKRHGWNMISTGTGLRYQIYKEGTGRKVEEGKAVRFNYETSLLTGKTCYTSKKYGPKEFLVGKGGVESGLEEAVLYLREGDRAKIILPSHLAFGLLGDEDCIPKRATVVYDIEITTVLDPINQN